MALDAPPLVEPDVDPTGPAIAAFAHALDQPGSQLGRLRDVFSLHALDLAVLAVLLAPELDHELERAYTFALDDFTRKRPDVGFVGRLVGAGDPLLADRVLARFDDAAPLRRHGLVTLADRNAETSASMRSARVADRIVSFIRGHDTIDELVRGCVRLPRFSPARAQIVMDPVLIERIARALLAPGARVLLAGINGVGRATLAEVIYGEVDRPVVRVDLEAMVADGTRIVEKFASAVREAALRDAAIVFEGGSLDRDVPRALAQAMADATAELGIPMVFAFTTHVAWIVNSVADLVELDIPLPTFRERLELWTRALPTIADPKDLETVAARYSFSAAVISGAARRSESMARLRDPANPKISLDDLGSSARLTFSHRLGEMAQRIPTGFTWDDLVLPVDTMEAVKEVTRFARYRAFLLEDWGFSAKLPYGRGVSAILAGPPGTGKTMVAQLIAHELGYDLYRIDLSQVVNKYIGETEKNLAKIFDEAETSHAVLFFDEADSLFAKRTDVKSSNDRYANLEVNYLLQRMETFDGVTLLATNIEQGLDEAFKRRVRFSVQFELPDEDVRAKLWKSMFPPKVPLADDIDWPQIAKRFEMSGGYIKKAVLRAALIAASAARPVTTTDILDAARQEYREMGRIV